MYKPPNNNHEDDSKLNSLLIVAQQWTIKKQLLVLGDFNYPDIWWNIGVVHFGTKQKEFIDNKWTILVAECQWCY